MAPGRGCIPTALLAGLLGTACASTSGTSPATSPAASPRPSASLSDRVAAAQSPSASERCQQLLPWIRQAAQEHGLDPSLLVGLVRTESNFRPDARSPVGAVGLTQVLPTTARAKQCGNLLDPKENLRCGAKVLRAFLDWYQGDLYLGLSGYNAGHGLPNRASRERTLPGNADYVESVLWGAARFQRKGCAF